MIRTLQTTLFFFLLCSVVFAQVPNHSFEDWTAGNPDDWQTTNIPIVPQSILQDTEAYTGNYCAHGIVVSNNSNQPFPPYLGISGPSAGGFPILLPFGKVDGYCKLNLNPGDKFVGFVHIYNSDGEPIGGGHLAIDISNSQWQPFSIELNYDSFDNSMTCALYFTITESTETGSGHIGSEFRIDNLTMSGLGTLNITAVENESVILFPNPVRDLLHLRIENNSLNSLCIITDAAGRVVRRQEVSRESAIDVSTLTDGIYFLKIKSNRSEYCRKIIVTGN